MSTVQKSDLTHSPDREKAIRRREQWNKSQRHRRKLLRRQKQRQLSVSISKDVNDAIKALCRQAEETRSQLIARLTRAALVQHEGASSKPRRRPAIERTAKLTQKHAVEYLRTCVELGEYEPNCGLQELVDLMTERDVLDDADRVAVWSKQLHRELELQLHLRGVPQTEVGFKNLVSCAVGSMAHEATQA